MKWQRQTGDLPVQCMVSTLFGEIEGCAAAVLSGLLIGSAATDPNTRNNSTQKAIFCFIGPVISQVSLQPVTGLTKLMRRDVQSLSAWARPAVESSAEVPQSPQLPGLALGQRKRVESMKRLIAALGLGWALIYATNHLLLPRAPIEI